MEGCLEHRNDDFGEQESNVINFSAYEDIPVETSGDNIPPPIHTCVETDLVKPILV